MKGYKRMLYFGIIVIAAGIVFTIAMADKVGSSGTVFIAMGGLFVIIGFMGKKSGEQEKNDS